MGSAGTVAVVVELEGSVGGAVATGASEAPPPMASRVEGVSIGPGLMSSDREGDMDPSNRSYRDTMAHKARRQVSGGVEHGDYRGQGCVHTGMRM